MKYSANTPITKLGLSVRAVNCLKTLGVSVLKDLFLLNTEDLENVRNAGRKTISEIMDFIDTAEISEDIDTEPEKKIMLPADVPVSELGFSNRTTNALYRGEIKTFGQLVSTDPVVLSRLRNLGQKSINEIDAFLSEHELKKDEPDAISDPNADYKAWCYENKQKITQFVAENIDEDTEDLPISVRSVNSLLLNKKKHLSDYLFTPEGDLISELYIDEDDAAEIRQYCKYFLRQNKELLIKELFQDNAQAEKTSQRDIHDYSIKEIFYDGSQYKEKALKYIRETDFSVDLLTLSVRSTNGLKKAGIEMFSQLAAFKDIDIRSLSALGDKSAREIIQKKWAVLSEREEDLKSYISGDYSALFSESKIEEMILNLFSSLGFQSLSYRRIREKLPDKLDETAVKHVIGKMIHDKKLEYVDFRIYRTYMSFFAFLDEYPFKDEKVEGVVKNRYNGMTLEEAAAEFGITRERARQIADKEFKKIKVEYVARKGVKYFDEDYYAYLFSTYSLDKELMNDYLNIDEKTMQYLKLSYSRGGMPLESALLDENLDLILRTRIRDYLNKDKISINGQLIDAKRQDVEEYVLRTCCPEEMVFDEFVEKYNQILKENGINNQRLHIADETIRTRENILSESRFILWKQGRRMRYYDIDSRDYDELLETLNLESYADTEVSTLKFMNMYPDLMKKYDIRDKYELHNLLKKICEPAKYHDIQFSRQPMIIFGEFDRLRMAYEVISRLSPVSIGDLTSYMEKEYGYEPLVFQANILGAFAQYYHAGVYSVDFKRIPEDRVSVIKAHLNEDFYYIDEVRKIYYGLFPDADHDEINPYSLKALGFIVYSRYVLKNWENSETYFNSLLLTDDFVDLDQLYRRYRYVQGFYDLVYDRKREYAVLEFEPGKLINIRRLQKAGITKEDIREYCDEVFNETDEGFFTIHSLRNGGFTSKLEELGFDDYFYGMILAVDPRFASIKALQSIILCKKADQKEVGLSSFISFCMKGHESIDLDELIEEMKAEYGPMKIERETVKEKIKNTSMYYDSIMDKVYLNEKYYYEEFDD